MKLKMLALVATSMIAISSAAGAQSAKPAFGTWGYDATAMDTAVKPGDDFWDYVNGNWAKRTQIAADRTFVGIDSILNDQIDKDVRAVVEDMAKNSASSGRIGQQVGDFYASWMDEAQIEKLGTEPLKPYLAQIAAAKDRSALIDLFATPGFPSPVGLAIFSDLKEPTRYSAYAFQDGLGLPNRDYYILQGEKYDKYRAAYRGYIIHLEQLAGIPDAAAKADRIIALETSIAKVHWTPEKSRDVEAIYNPMTRAKLSTFAPQFEWGRALDKLGLTGVDTIVVGQTSAIADEGKLFESVPLDTWKDWLAFHFISDHAEYLPKAFDQAKFDFYSKTLRDVETQRDRWKRGVDLVNGALGEAVGQIYVQRHYPPESDRQMQELIANIRAALKEKIETNGWMDQATKTEALAKLASFDPRTGHPVKYIDYSTLEVKRDDLLGNVMRSSQFDW
ncbi:MAG TPA: M13 family metallopeptidase N-terminal domain-containing protein, partial [Sphingomicrobium sp.]|nr:M13 family metallopeptidase N-terminal domain-containing protein [Sphingomicrobium sp.]